MYDIIVVGGGPAGLTAAVYALRAGRSVLVIEKNGFGGQIAFSPKVENIPGTKLISGTEFADQITDQAMALGADMELENVIKVEVEGDVKKVYTEEGSVLAFVQGIQPSNVSVFSAYTFGQELHKLQATLGNDKLNVFYLARYGITL